MHTPTPQVLGHVNDTDVLTGPAEEPRSAEKAATIAIKVPSGAGPKRPTPSGGIVCESGAAVKVARPATCGDPVSFDKRGATQTPPGNVVSGRQK